MPPVRISTPVTRAIRAYIREIGKLEGPQETLARMALRLAKEYDAYVDGDLTKLARANMELRQTLMALRDAAVSKDNDEDAKILSTPEWTETDGHRGSEMPAVVRDASQS